MLASQSFVVGSTVDTAAAKIRKAPRKKYFAHRLDEVSFLDIVIASGSQRSRLAPFRLSCVPGPDRKHPRAHDPQAEASPGGERAAMDAWGAANEREPRERGALTVRSSGDTVNSARPMGIAIPSAHPQPRGITSGGRLSQPRPSKRVRWVRRGPLIRSA